MSQAFDLLLNSSIDILSEKYLDDVQLSDFLRQFFSDPIRYVTTDEAALLERNRILNCLADDEPLYLSLEELSRQIGTLNQVVKFFELDSVQFWGSISVCKDIYQSMKNLIDKIGDPKCDWFAAAKTFLQDILKECFYPGFDDLWKIYASGSDILQGIRYRFTLDHQLRIQSIAVKEIVENRYIKKKRPWEFNAVTELAQNDKDTQNSRYHTSRNLNIPQLLKVNMNRIYLEQIKSAHAQFRFFAMRLVSRLKTLNESLDYIIGAYRYQAYLIGKKLPLCFAKVCKAEEAYFIKGMLHPEMAQRGGAVVLNDLTVENHDAILLIGGMNHGGKTTFLRSLGAALLLFQLGLPLLAQSAQLRIFKHLVSVFSEKEDNQFKGGKLGHEMTQIATAIQSMNPESFFLFNEPVCASSPAENYLLSKEILCMMKALCLNGVWVSHAYALFDDIPHMNQWVSGSQLLMLRTASDAEEPYSIHEGKPQWDSEAFCELTDHLLLLEAGQTHTKYF